MDIKAFNQSYLSHNFSYANRDFFIFICAPTNFAAVFIYCVFAYCKYMHRLRIFIR